MTTRQRSRWKSPGPSWSEAPAVGLAALAGAGLSTQSFVNGRLAMRLGSSLGASTVSTAIGVSVLLIVAAGRGRASVGFSRLRPKYGFRLWHLSAGLFGGLLLTLSTHAAPLVGIALLTVAVVAGQVVGGLIVDTAGIGPAGRVSATWPRLGGTALAVSAVLVGASSGAGSLRIGMLLLLGLAGAGSAVQQAAVGCLRNTTGDPLVAAVIALAVSVAFTAVLLIGSRSQLRLDQLRHVSVLLLAGGPLGAAIMMTIASVVSTIGVLRMALSLVAGQTAAGVVFDLVTPVAHNHVDWHSLVSVVLALVAVALGVSRASLSRDSVR